MPVNTEQDLAAAQELYKETNSPRDKEVLAEMVAEIDPDFGEIHAAQELAKEAQSTEDLITLREMVDADRGNGEHQITIRNPLTDTIEKVPVTDIGSDKFADLHANLGKTVAKAVIPESEDWRKTDEK